ncbi:MAG: chitobiase/beta-hexosaminidase C-terminal domain-containing protein [Candidatus Riflebacteria bacterium]|nr:chitobiase/beta-hexosaminidase C-terminal domain-containing protein [Candidatus Riflebacteria bacterium]
MIGWGAEDLPYRLANAGYKVVLSCVSNNYFDLAYSKSPDEPGYYWGGFQDIDKPFYFVPYDYYSTTKEDAAGNPANPNFFSGKDRLTDYGKSNIVGIQGLLWAENVRSNDLLDYLLLPKFLSLAERAWAKDPSWATETDKEKKEQLYNNAWSEFVNIVGKRELPRLAYFDGGFKYRIPPVGTLLKNGKLMVNLQLPGLDVHYTTDGTEPTVKSKICTGTISDKGTIKIRAFDTTGRGGKITIIEN